jgi:uncharacterized protein
VALHQPAARVTGLYVYPVKSCAGISLTQAEIGPRGILHDREFMLVSPAGEFLTQRELPALALVRPALEAGGVCLEAPGMPALRVTPTDAGPRTEVTIWRNRVVAVDQGALVAEWFTTYLSLPVRLMRLPADSVRPVDPQFAPGPEDQVGFADAFPLLLISGESLDDLNTRLAEELPMNRFRPNVVVRGAGAYAEDGWAEVRVGQVTCHVVKACARCVITTTDQRTATRGVEPLATLASYRRVPRGVLFGQNLIHTAPGRLALGDALWVVRHAAYGLQELQRLG